MTTLSVVIPIKDEKDNLRQLHEAVRSALNPLVGVSLRDYEVLLVDDGSTDGSLELLQELASRDARVKVICLRRNFGQTPALRAGIDWATGEAIGHPDATVDVDRDVAGDRHPRGRGGLRAGAGAARGHVRAAADARRRARPGDGRLGARRSGP